MKPLALLRHTRPHYSLPLSSGILVIAGYAQGGHLTALGPPLWAGWAALYCLLSAGYIHNDLCDRDCDAINRPQRAMPAGQAEYRTAGKAATLLALVGLGLAAGVGMRFFLIALLLAAGLLFYNLQSKRLGFAKNLLVALLTTLLYPLALALGDPVDTPRLGVFTIHPAWLFLTTLAYEMLKDIPDVPGDRIAGTKLIPIDCQSHLFLISARSIALCASLLTLIPWALGYCHTLYLASAILAIVLALIATTQPYRRAIPLLYLEVVVITLGSWADLWVFGP